MSRLAMGALALLLVTANAPAQSSRNNNRDDSDSNAQDDSNRSNQQSDRSRSNTQQSSRGSQSSQLNRQSHATLGVTFYNDEHNPLEIRRVSQNSPAEEAGLERGDEILSVNGRRISSVQQLRQQIDRTGQAEEIEIGILRDGRRDTVTADLSGRQRSQNRQYGNQQWSNQQYANQGNYDRGYGEERYATQGYGNQGYDNQGYGNQRSGSQGYNNRGFGNQGYGRQGYSNRGYGNEGNGNQGYGNRGYANQGYGNQGNNNQGYDEQGNGNRTYARASRGADYDDQQWNRGAQNNRRQEEQERAFLGVTLDEESGEDGAFVTNVYPESPAQRAGIRPGDEIIAIDDDEVRSTRDLQRNLSERDPDEDVSIEIHRNGRQRTLHVRLESYHEFLAQYHQQNQQGNHRTGRRAGYRDDNQQSYQDGNRRQQRGQDEDQQQEDENY